MRIVPIIKTVGVACNLKCRYCWFNSLDQSKVERMPEKLLEKLVRDYAEADDSGSFQFIWHGGEPLLAGIKFFEAALRFQKLYMAGAKIKNVIQTNGTMLTPNWVSFFLENRFKVGVSLDGPREFHDAYRITPRGAGSYNRIMKNLVSARKLGLKFSVIATVNKSNVGAPDELFDFFVGHGINSFGFNMVFERDSVGIPMSFSISNEEYADFQCRIFDRWLERDDPKLRIRHIDSIVGGMLGLPVRSCIYAGTCHRFFNINSNGDVYPCERLTDAPRLGNLQESSLSDIVRASPYQAHCTMTNDLPSDCKSCRFLKVCRNGCTHHRVDGKLYFCEGRKQVFRHIESALNRIAEWPKARKLTPIPVSLARLSVPRALPDLCRKQTRRRVGQQA